MESFGSLLTYKRKEKQNSLLTVWFTFAVVSFSTRNLTHRLMLGRPILKAKINTLLRADRFMLQLSLRLG